MTEDKPMTQENPSDTNIRITSQIQDTKFRTTHWQAAAAHALQQVMACKRAGPFKTTCHRNTLLVAFPTMLSFLFV